MRLGLFRVGTSQCTILVEGCSSPVLHATRHVQDFRPLEPTGPSIKVNDTRFYPTNGRKFFNNGQLRFTVPLVTRADGFYTTVFGLSFPNNGVILANSAHNINHAISRLTLVRKGSSAIDTDLVLCQRQFLREAGEFLDSLAHIIQPHYDLYTTNLEQVAAHHADPHPKKALRVAAYQELVRDGDLDKDLWMSRGSKVAYKLKKFEVAKPGKVARMIGDLGVSASLQGAWFIKPIKEALDGCHTIGNFSFEFCARPEPSRLTTIFKRLLNPPTRVYFVYFSDDSCLSIRHDGRVHTYNMDIKKCDSSHRGPIFLALLKLVPPRYRIDMQRLIDQCRLPITIRNPDAPKERVTLRPVDYSLYSGSTLTTIINNLANLLIAKSISDDGAFAPPQIEAAAYKVGYLVELETCTQPQDIQFLKHSPVYDTTGKLRAMLNLGVLLRASGKCKGDLPRGGSIYERACAFQHALVKGMYPRTSFSLRNSMLAATGGTNQASIERVQTLLAHKTVDEGPTFAVDDHALFQRYRITPADAHELIAACQHGVGFHHVGRAANAIYLRDYGLTST